MGGRKSIHGASGRGDLLMFDPEVLKVVTDRKHSRFDPRVEREIDEAMVASIMRLGVVEPLVISRDGEDVYVEDGRQRRANAIEANKRFKKSGGQPIAVPCVWRRGDDASLFEVAVALNEVRSGDAPIERARKMQRLADFGRSEAQIAVVFGCTTQTVKSHLTLLECAPEVQRAVEAGKLPATVATKMAKLPREEQKSTLAEMVAAGATKGGAATRALQAKRDGGDVEKPTRMRSRKFLERYRDGVRALGDDWSLAVAEVIDFALGAEPTLNVPQFNHGEKNGKSEEEESALGLPQGRQAEKEAGAQESEVDAAGAPAVQF